jgi:hypothetical protein
MIPPGMAWVQAGEFVMGSDDFYREERPAHYCGRPARLAWSGVHPDVAVARQRLAGDRGCDAEDDVTLGRANADSNDGRAA